MGEEGALLSSTPVASEGSVVVVRLLDGDTSQEISRQTVTLSQAQAKSGQLEVNFTIEREPELVLETVTGDTWDWGSIYAGLMNQRELDISNQGDDLLRIEGVEIGESLESVLQLATPLPLEVGEGITNKK